MSEEGNTILTPYEDPNAFEVLQPSYDESIPDVEPVEQILLRMMRSSNEEAERASEQEELKFKSIKMRSFAEGELDESWTIVARRRSSSQQIPDDEATLTPTTSTPVTSASFLSETVETPEKPSKLWRWLAAAGTVAVVGVVSFFVLKPRQKKNE